MLNSTPVRSAFTICTFLVATVLLPAADRVTPICSSTEPLRHGQFDPYASDLELIDHLQLHLRPPEAETESAPLGEDPEDREHWFSFQRSYPRGVPDKARLRAWEQLKRGHLNIQSLVPAAGPTWRAIGPSPTYSSYIGNWGVTSGRINAVAVSPVNPQLVVIGSATGGIWRSVDGGFSFDPVSDDQVDLAVGSIAFSRSNPSLVYAGMGDSASGYLGTGILKSTNAGKDWIRVSNSSLPAPGTIAKIQVDSANADRVYIAQSTKLVDGRASAGGFYFSTDGGVNWTRTLPGSARDFAIDPGNRQVLYATINRPEVASASLQPGLFKSTNAGLTWTSVFASPYDAGNTRDVRVALSGSNTVYCYLGGVADGGFSLRFVVSTDAGVSWSRRNTDQIDPAQFGYNTFVAAHPSNPQVVYIGARDLFKSTDGGFSWSNLTDNFFDIGFGWTYAPRNSTAHPDQHALALSPDDSNVIYIGNDGGVSKSYHGGASFTSMNMTLTLSQFIGIAIDPANPLITYGGTQDNGTQKRFGASPQWSEFSTGDGGHPVVDPLNSGTVYVTYVRGDIFRFRNQGGSYDTRIASNSTFGEPDVGARIAFYPPFTGNGVDSTLYFGTWRLFVSIDGGDSWTAPADATDLTKGITAAGRDVLTAIGVSRADTRIIYTGSAQGRAMISRDGGLHWDDITRGLPDRFITSIAVDRGSPETAYLTVSGFRSGHVFKTTDMGITWLDISGTLPDVPANVVLIDPNNREVLYIGTDIGVFRSTSGGRTWKGYNDGLPPVIIHDFAADGAGVIQVATYGRGVFETEGAPGPPVISSVELSGKRLTISGVRFAEGSQVIINGADRSSFIRSIEESSIRVKGAMAKLGLVAGDNSVKVVSNGASSSTFTFRL